MGNHVSVVRTATRNALIHPQTALAVLGLGNVWIRSRRVAGWGDEAFRNKAAQATDTLIAETPP